MNKTVAFFAVLTGFAACNDEPPIPPGFGVVSLGATASDPHDVAQFEFRVIENGSGDCSAGTIVASSTIAINANTMMADDMFVVPADDYLVCALPQQSDGTPSAECAEASATTTVIDGQTTSMGLTSTCTGGGNGAIDVSVTLEEFPLITDIDFSPSKYFEVCDEVTITATLDDPGSDGFNAIAWTVQAAPVGATPVLGTPDQISTTFTTDTVGDYTLELVVDDQVGGVQALTFPMTALDCQTGGTTTWLRGAVAASTSIDIVTDVAAAGDDTIAVGKFVSSLNLGAGAMSATGSNAFVWKLDDAGATVWAVEFGTVAANATRVAVDGSGDVFVVGDTGTSGVSDFPGSACGALASGGYLAMLDGTNGDCIWATGLTPTTNQFVDLAVDGNGAVALAYVDAAVIRIERRNNVGTLLWAKSIDGTDFDYATAVAVDASTGAVLVAGNTESATVAFPGGQVVSFTAIGAGFVTKLNANTGDAEWVHTAAGTGTAQAPSVAVTSAGEVVTAWEGFGDVDLGGGTFTLAGNAIVELTSAGAFQSQRHLADANALSGLRLEAAPGGQVRVVARLNGTLDLGLGPMTTTDYEVLVFSMFPSTGTVVWATRGDPITTVEFPRLAVAADGSTIVGGGSNAAFTFGSASLPFVGFIDLFVAKLSP